MNTPLGPLPAAENLSHEEQAYRRAHGIVSLMPAAAFERLRQNIRDGDPQRKAMFARIVLLERVVAAARDVDESRCHVNGSPTLNVSRNSLERMRAAFAALDDTAPEITKP